MLDVLGVIIILGCGLAVFALTLAIVVDIGMDVSDKLSKRHKVIYQKAMDTEARVMAAYWNGYRDGHKYGYDEPFTPGGE